MEFLRPPRGAYFDCANKGLWTRRSVEIARQDLQRLWQPWNHESVQLEADRLRASFAKLLGSDIGCIALVPSTSYAMTLATTLFPVPQQSEIVIAGNEHGNAVAGWIGAARSASLIHAVPPDTQKILERITARTSIVCLPQVHWITGARFDLEEVGRHARAVGAKLIVDGTQSVGAMPFDIDVIQPDMLCVSGYKWLLGPRGVTYIYLPPKHHGLAPMENSWSNRSEDHSARFDASGRAIYDAPWLEGARRFDAGGHNSLLLACAFEGLEVIHRLTPNAIQTRLAETNRWIAFQNPELTFDTHGDAVTHIVSLAVHNRAMVMELLRENGVFASLRGNRLRLSGHYWNTANDFDLLSEFLKTLKP